MRAAKRAPAGPNSASSGERATGERVGRERASGAEDALAYGDARDAAARDRLKSRGSGRLAQRESASFTPRRSLVRSQYRPLSSAASSGQGTGRF